MKKLNVLRNHVPSFEQSDLTKKIYQEIETKRLQTEDIKKAQGEIQSVIDDKSNKAWTAKKTFDDLISQNSNIRSIATRIAISKRGKTEPELEDWPDIQKYLEDFESDMKTLLTRRLTGNVPQAVIEARDNFVKIAKENNMLIDQAIENNRRIDSQFEEMQNRAKQADQSKQLRGMYASVISKVYDELPEEQREAFIAHHFNDRRVMTQITADTTEYNNGQYPLNDPTITLNDPSVLPINESN